MGFKQEIYKLSITNCNDAHTKQTYWQSAAKFAAWTREVGYKSGCLLKDTQLARTALQEYTNTMINQGYSPATIHTRLAAPCKALRVSMSDISKPKRVSGAVTRSRGRGNAQGKTEAQKPENARLVTFQRAVGIRRAELARLHGSDLVHDESGMLCIQVASGKGGKHQLQRILPKDEPTVTAIMRERGLDNCVFTAQELSNQIDLHGMRAAHARAAYDHYVAKLEANPLYRDQLRAELVARWDAERPKSSYAQRKAYIAKLNNEHKLYLRKKGDNYNIAIKNGRPVVYDRLAVMAVSVFHLSHWRTDVTVTHYLV